MLLLVEIEAMDSISKSTYGPGPKRLNQTHREILIRFVLGYSREEIAEDMGVSKKTVSRITKCRLGQGYLQHVEKRLDQLGDIDPGLVFNGHVDICYQMSYRKLVERGGSEWGAYHAIVRALNKLESRHRHNATSGHSQSLS
jgi:hypothetical protein